MGEIVQAGKYKFIIKRNIQTYDDRIINHTYKIGGDYDNCIQVSYKYENNRPVLAKLPYLLYEPECALGSFLERGSGTEIIIRTIILYAYNEVRSIPLFQFDDDSHIDCVEKDLSKSPRRPNIKPLNLAFFYIAYHGKTWYEARFNAKMIDHPRYDAYKKSLHFMTDPIPPFIIFLQIIGISLESKDIIETLEKYYSKASTYREFFEAIPKIRRCEILYGWLNTFMNHYIGNVFTDKGWYIDVNNMNTPTQTGGSLSRSMKYKIFSYKNISSF